MLPWNWVQFVMLQHVSVWQHCRKLSGQHCRLSARSPALSTASLQTDAFGQKPLCLFSRVKCKNCSVFWVLPNLPISNHACCSFQSCEKGMQIFCLQYIKSLLKITSLSLPFAKRCCSSVKCMMTQNYLTWALNLITVAILFNGIL